MERAVPVLDKIKTWLDAEGQIVLLRSPMATAIGYAQSQWTALNAYVKQGCLSIDNNAAERAMKRVALGRKNWLFAGQDAAAENHARLWSLIASAERHGVDPQRYLTSALANLPLLRPNDCGAGAVDSRADAGELAPILPDVSKRSDAAEPQPA